MGDGLEPRSQIIIDDDGMFVAAFVVQTALGGDENLVQGSQKGLVFGRSLGRRTVEVAKNHFQRLFEVR